MTAQDRPSGEYEACFNSISQDTLQEDTCLNILLNEDNSFSLQVKYPKEIRTQNGYWKQDGNSITLTPYNNSSDYFDLHNSLLDKLLPGRVLEVKEKGLFWKIKDKPALVLKKIQKCNC